MIMNAKRNEPGLFGQDHNNSSRDYSQEYYWVDAWDSFVGEPLNPEGQSWAAGYWMENEPSFTSEGDMELYMNLVHYQENWVLNDVPADITVYYPGKTGYICEFDE